VAPDGEGEIMRAENLRKRTKEVRGFEKNWGRCGEQNLHGGSRVLETKGKRGARIVSFVRKAA